MTYYYWTSSGSSYQKSYYYTIKDDSPYKCVRPEPQPVSPMREFEQDELLVFTATRGIGDEFLGHVFLPTKLEHCGNTKQCKDYASGICPGQYVEIPSLIGWGHWCGFTMSHVDQVGKKQYKIDITDEIIEFDDREQ